MSASRDSLRPVQFGLAAFLGTFLFIPLWDLFALIYTLRIGWRSSRGEQDKDRANRARSILFHPIRGIALMLIAYAIAILGVGALKGVIAQPGPFGFVVTGAQHYAELAPPEQQCCEFSTTIAPGRPVSAIMAERIPNTLRLLAGVSIAGMFLTAALVTVALLVHQLGKRREMWGTIVYSLLRLLTVRAMAAPTAGLTLVVVMFLGIRYRLIPIAGVVSMRTANAGTWADRLWHLIAPSILIALIPALIAAQAGVRAWLDREERGLSKRGSWAILGTSVARAFIEQAGWMLGLTMIVESLVAYPGVGRTLLDAIIRQDAPMLVAALATLPLWLLIARLRAILTESAQRAYLLNEESDRHIAALQPAAKPVRPRTIDQIWLVVTLALIAVMLAPVVRGLFVSPQAARDMSFQDGQPLVYAAPSPDHPLGTDGQGRDVEARLLEARRVTLGITVIGGLIALTLGGLWGGISILLKSLRPGVLGEVAAHMIRIPAEAAILLHPTLVALAFTVSYYSTQRVSHGQSISMVGFAVGLALIPRMAWGIEALWDTTAGDRSLRWRLGGTLLVALAAALFVTFQYSILVCFMGLGVQFPTASLGNMLSNYYEIMGGTAAVSDARFYLLAVAISGAAAVPAMTFYILQDVLTDYFGFRRKDFLPRLLS